MDTLFRVEMLGRFVVRQGSREITRFRTQKTASLLACLSLYRSRTHPREVLIEYFWPDSEFKAARSNLSVALNALRRQLEPPGVPTGAILIADHAQVRLNPAAFTTDVESFQKAIREAELAKEPEARIAFWMAALDLYCGDLLPGYYEDWLLAERDRLRESYRTVLRNVVKGCAELGEQERALEHARRLVQADSLREDSYSLLIHLLLEMGRPYDALHQYQELERLLHQELHTTPSATIRELVAPLHDLPMPHRKTLEGCTSVCPRKEITASVPAPVLDAQRPPYRVPHPFTHFFGRVEEIAHLTEWLPPADQSPGRLFTLTGVGGTGKTRLSIEVAGRVKEAFPGGIWFIPLAELEDPQRLGEVLRDTLELPRQTRLSALDQVIAFLNSREGASLLILDNFEQVAAGGAPVVWTLLNRVPLLRCLVTSRRPLSLPGEREIPIAPLPVPVGSPGETAFGSDDKPTPHHALMACPSVALFVDRAQAVRPEFQITPRNAEAVAALCGKLEGIPLAIELAAARARALTPSQILERLTERFDLLSSRRTDKGERHRSLWAAIDWSYHLLSPELQQLFVRLSVFRGGWTLEAAEAVAGGSVVGGRWSVAGGERVGVSGQERERVMAGKSSHSPKPSIPFTPNTQHPTPNTHHSHPDHRPPTTDHLLDSLAILRGHSLIQVEESSTTIRFRMLETLREFAVEQLTPEEREEKECCHATYFHQWVTGATLSGPEQATWFSRFEEDRDNLRAALECSQRVSAEMHLELANSLARFWKVRGYLAEGCRWLESGLRASKIPDALRARTLDSVGVLAYRQGDCVAAQEFHEQSLALWKRLGDSGGLSNALNHLGNLASDLGDYPLACSLYEESLTLQRERGDHRGIAISLYNLGRVALSESNYPLAQTLYAESLTIRRAIDDIGGIAYSLHGLGLIAEIQGDYATARSFYVESLAKHREAGDRAGVASTLSDLGDVMRVLDDYATARAMYEESLTTLREVGEVWQLGVVLNNLGLLECALGNYDAARSYYEQSLVVKQQIGDRRGVAYSLHYLGKLAFAQRDYETARTFYREALTIRQDMQGHGGILDSLDGFTGLAEAQGQWERATQLFAAVETLCVVLGEVASPEEQKERGRRAAQLRNYLGENAFGTAWQIGMAMTWEQAIAYALADSANAISSKF